jgi:hypothetical protein
VRRLAAVLVPAVLIVPLVLLAAAVLVRRVMLVLVGGAWVMGMAVRCYAAVSAVELTLCV